MNKFVGMVIATALLAMPLSANALTFKSGEKKSFKTEDTNQETSSGDNYKSILPDPAFSMDSQSLCNWNMVVGWDKIPPKTTHAFENFDLKTSNGELSDILGNVQSDLQRYHAGYVSNPTDGNKNKLISYLKFLFRHKFSYQMGDAESDNHLFHKGTVLALMYTFNSLKANDHLGSFESTFRNQIHLRFKQLRLIGKHYDMPRCTVGGDLFGCQNHTYGFIHARTLYGHLFDQQTHFRMGEKLFKFAINDLAEDGALWREAKRGARSWNYYTHALNHLMAIGEIYHLTGNSLYGYQAEKSGKTIHDAVRFLLDALTDNGLMLNYAKANVYGGRRNFDDPHHLYRIINGNDGYKNWFYIYQTRFPNHPNTKLGQQLLNLYSKLQKESNHMGFFAQCLYSEGHKDSAAQIEKVKTLTIVNSSASAASGYERTEESLTQRFECLKREAALRDFNGLPSDEEIQALIRGLEGVTFYRTKRHLTKLGISSDTLKTSRKFLLHLINYEYGAAAYCNRVGDNFDRLRQ